GPLHEPDRLVEVCRVDHTEAGEGSRGGGEWTVRCGRLAVPRSNRCRPSDGCHQIAPPPEYVVLSEERILLVPGQRVPVLLIAICEAQVLHRRRLLLAAPGGASCSAAVTMNRGGLVVPLLWRPST